MGLMVGRVNRKRLIYRIAKANSGADFYAEDARWFRIGKGPSGRKNRKAAGAFLFKVEVGQSIVGGARKSRRAGKPGVTARSTGSAASAGTSGAGGQGV